MADLVPVTEIQVSYGRALTSGQAQQASQWQGDALLEIKKRLGDPNELDQDALKYVVREAVVMRLKRPDPVTQSSVTVDDATTAKAYEKSTGAIEILDAWWTLLTPDTAAATTAFTIRPGRARGDRGPGPCW